MYFSVLPSFPTFFILCVWSFSLSPSGSVDLRKMAALMPPYYHILTQGIFFENVDIPLDCNVSIVYKIIIWKKISLNCNWLDSNTWNDKNVCVVDLFCYYSIFIYYYLYFMLLHAITSITTSICTIN